MASAAAADGGAAVGETGRHQVVWWKKKDTISPGYAYIGREARNAAD